MVQIKNGKIMNVFPLEFAESKIRYAFKAWKERWIEFQIPIYGLIRNLVFGRKISLTALKN